MKKLQIRYVDPFSLKKRVKNPRTHTRGQINQIARSIGQFGFISPVLIDTENRIVVGHARVEAAKQMKMTDVPVVQVGHLSPEQIRAYVIADNKLAEKAGWDNEILAIEFEELGELDFDLTLTGFDMPEIDLLLGAIGESGQDEADIAPVIDRSVPAISKLGDTWQIGEHRLTCGDALEAATYDKLLNGRLADMVFTDPPYNVAIDGHVSGLGKVKHRDFAMASGEMNSREFTNFLEKSFRRLSECTVDGSIHFVCMDWRHMRELLDAADGVYSDLKNLCVWAKTNAGMGSLYRSQHELVFVFKKGNAPHINNVALGKYGRNRSNLWSYAGVNTFSKSRKKELAMHPTVKPLKMVTDAILDCSNRGGIILDPFAGSGTTLVAAEKAGRIGHGIELDPYFVDAAIKRMADTYSLEAIHAVTGANFSEIAGGSRG